MNIPSIGQEFRNYRAVCAYLNEPVLEGNSKQAQLSRWSTSFSWLREGNKWIVVDHEATIGRPLRGARWAKYLDPHICLLIYSALKQRGTPAYTKTTLHVKEVILFSLEGLVQLGFCNHSYRRLRDNELEGFTHEEQQEFYDLSFSRIYTLMINAFHRLHENGTIVYTRTYVVEDKGNARLVTMDEQKDINTLKATLLSDYGKTEAAIVRSSLRDRFYEDFRLIVKVQLGFTKVYSVHNLRFTDDSIEELPRVSAIMEQRKQHREGINKESVKMHMALFPNPPLSNLANLVIPQIES